MFHIYSISTSSSPRQQTALDLPFLRSLPPSAWVLAPFPWLQLSSVCCWLLNLHVQFRPLYWFPDLSTQVLDSATYTTLRHLSYSIIVKGIQFLPLTFSQFLYLLAPATGLCTYSSFPLFPPLFLYNSPSFLRSKFVHHFLQEGILDYLPTTTSQSPGSVLQVPAFPPHQCTYHTFPS